MSTMTIDDRGARTLADVSRAVDELRERVKAREIERWSRVRMVAAAIPDDADLDDDADVVRALYAARFTAGIFSDCLSEAIDHARKDRLVRFNAAMIHGLGL